ncbi:MAG: hypothetical protein FWE05_06825 [Defluviitaleaceae bacterium]|nr:hypothetical protein [Defluviitaleaceae bacterium]
MYKITIAILIFSCAMFLSACSSHNDCLFDDDTAIQTSIIQDDEHVEPIRITIEQEEYRIQDMSVYDPAFSAFIAQAANELRSNFDFHVDVTTLVLDIQSNSIVASYGDIDRYGLAAHALWPVSSALMFDVYDISVYDEFINVPFVLESGETVRSAISLWSDEYYVGDISFMQGIFDGNQSLFFHALENKDLNIFFDALKKLNLSQFEDTPSRDSLFEYMTIVQGNFLINPREFALLYASLANGGRLFSDIDANDYVQAFSESSLGQTGQILDGLLNAIDNNWVILEQVWDRQLFSDFERNVLGTTVSYITELTHEDIFSGAWFIGIYPADSPRYIIVINASHSGRYFMQDFPGYQNRRPVGMHTVSNVAYEIYEYMQLRDLDEDLGEGIPTDFLPRIEDINILLNGEFEGFLYVGRDTCHVCLVFNVYLYEIYSSANELSIYFFDTDYWREHEYFNVVLERFHTSNVPALVHMIDEDSFYTFLPNILTISEERELLNQFFEL